MKKELVGLMADFFFFIVFLYFKYCIRITILQYILP